jgi:hypothetical protein
MALLHKNLKITGNFVLLVAKKPLLNAHRAILPYRVIIIFKDLTDLTQYLHALSRLIALSAESLFRGPKIKYERPSKFLRNLVA